MPAQDLTTMVISSGPTSPQGSDYTLSTPMYMQLHPFHGMPTAVSQLLVRSPMVVDRNAMSGLQSLNEWYAKNLPTRCG